MESPPPTQARHRHPSGPDCFINHHHPRKSAQRQLVQRKLHHIKPPSHWNAISRRHFRDASGLPLFEISRQNAGVTWYLHLPGESSSSSSSSSSRGKEKTRSEPIATVVPKYSALKDKFDVHFRNIAADGNGEETVLEVRGQNIWKSRTNVYHHGRVVMTVRLTDMVAAYIPGKRPRWEVVVAEGMDLSLAAVIAVLLATMLYQSSEAPSNALTNSSY
ncbi:tubby C-terminal-like domain-containing protein [Aspergillus egyptiacus]|nr:tubby C-terminal-like domain-containing protein [Aspergillus egyptiacus]